MVGAPPPHPSTNTRSPESLHKTDSDLLSVPTQRQFLNWTHETMMRRGGSDKTRTAGEQSQRSEGPKRRNAASKKIANTTTHYRKARLRSLSKNLEGTAEKGVQIKAKRTADTMQHDPRHLHLCKVRTARRQVVHCPSGTYKHLVQHLLHLGNRTEQPHKRSHQQTAQAQILTLSSSLHRAPVQRRMEPLQETNHHSQESHLDLGTATNLSQVVDRM